jgi:polar amino acid transport system substrate-binding protein
MRRWCRLRSALAGLGIMLCAPLGTPSSSRAAAAPQVDLHALLPARIQQSGVLVIATDAHHPPNESFAEDGKTIVGFEPDLWNTLAKLLGVKAEVISVDFDGLIPGVQSGRFDVAFESISDSPAREQQVSFVDFAAATAVLYTLADNSAVTSDPSSLCGLKGGVQSGTDFDDSVHRLSAGCVLHGKPAIDVKEYASDAAVVMALYSQRVDFALNDRMAAQKMIEFAPHPLKIVDVGLPKFTVGAITRRDDTALASALLAAFQRMHADGTYQAILAKWQIDSLALAQPGMNLAAGRP